MRKLNSLANKSFRIRGGTSTSFERKVVRRLQGRTRTLPLSAAEVKVCVESGPAAPIAAVSPANAGDRGAMQAAPCALNIVFVSQASGTKPSRVNAVLSGKNRREMRGCFVAARSCHSRDGQTGKGQQLACDPEANFDQVVVR